MAQQEQFGILISAVDRTRAGFASVLRGASEVGGKIRAAVTAPLRALANPGSMALVYNTQAMMRSAQAVYEGFNRIATESAKLNVVNASFSRMTGASAKAADGLAQGLKDAALGMITLGQAKEVANRALASGMSMDQLRTAMEFISKKSVTTGIDAGQALQTVITGLSRGSTLFLDDFGILVDGTEQVKRNYDAIKGSGAFESLGPAAQKAEIVRAAIAEMNQQMGKIGVRGDELVFRLGRIKTTFDEIKLKAGQALLPLADAAADAMESLTGKIDVVVGGFVATITRNYGQIKTMFAASFESVGTMLGSTLNSVWRAAIGGMSVGDMVAGLSTTFAKLPIYMAQGFLKMKDVFGDFLKHFLEGLGKFTMIMGEGLGKAMSLFGWGGVKKGKQVVDAFADAGAEIWGMGGKAKIAMRVTAKETEALEEGLKKIADQAAQMKTEVTQSFRDMATEAGAAARARIVGVWTQTTGAASAALNSWADKSRQAAAASVDAAKRVGEAWSEAGNKLRSAVSALHGAQRDWANLMISRREDRDAANMAAAGRIPWMQNRIRYEQAEWLRGQAAAWGDRPDMAMPMLEKAWSNLQQVRMDFAQRGAGRGDWEKLNELAAMVDRQQQAILAKQLEAAQAEEQAARAKFNVEQQALAQAQKRVEMEQQIASGGAKVVQVFNALQGAADRAVRKLDRVGGGGGGQAEANWANAALDVLLGAIF